MLNHSVLVSDKEAELGFALYDLPSTEDAIRWNGKFEKVCAKRIGPSSFLMKFEGESGPDYYQFKWGVSKMTPNHSPLWLPTGRTYTDPEMAIHNAELEMHDVLKIIEHPLPQPDSY